MPGDKLIVRNIVRKDCYLDSVLLMAAAVKLKALEGVLQVSCVMGTEENRRIVAGVNLLTDEGAAAGRNDLLIAIQADDEHAVERALAEIDRSLAERGSRASSDETSRPRSLNSAHRLRPEANLVLLSLPGRYVRREAMAALERNLHVFIFSDNVPLEHELALKRKATEDGLLVMGPDCGTAIVNGTALGFANSVRRGRIGIVAAAGTGLQEVSTLIHRGGAGVSQGIGTGGRDLKEKIGGLTMLAAMRALEADHDTDVIVLISKPPSAAVARRIIERAEAGKKPYVVNFLGCADEEDREGLHFADTLEMAALKAVSLGSGVEISLSQLADERETTLLLARSEWVQLPPGRRYVRGLFSGGTLCYEAQYILGKMLGHAEIYSNTPLDSGFKLEDSDRSVKDTLVDLGEDEFTVGRPHPMIDFTLRNERIIQEAADPGTAVILLDVVLGYGTHPDPAGALADSIAAARRRKVSVAVSICGTEDDPQVYSRQKSLLEDAGAVVLPSNAELALFAVAMSTRLTGFLS